MPRVKKIYVWTTKVRPLRIPAIYQEVEYIQSSWTQYISTWYNPQTTTQFNVSYEWVSYPQQYQNVFGTRQAYNQKWYFIGYNYTENKNYCWFGSNFKNGIACAIWGTWVKNITYANWVLSDGTNTLSVSVNATPTTNLYIFCDNDNWTANEFGSLKLYSLKLYESWTLVRDYVPCYRKSDSVIWLYDLVSNAFLTNAWTGTFTKWANV